MTIHGIGVDLVEIERVADLLARWDRRFLDRVFLPGEIAYCQARKNSAQHFAARLAAKEAASKALGTGWRKGVHWKTVEVVRGRGRRPAIRLHGRARELAEQWGVGAIHLSVSHSRRHAVAQVVMEKTPGDGVPRNPGVCLHP